MPKLKIYDTGIEADIPEGFPDWRDVPDPSGEEDDDVDRPAPEYVKSLLGFDPDDLWKKGKKRKKK